MSTDRLVASSHVSRLIGGVALVPVLAYLWVAGQRIGYPYELEWMEGGSVEWVRSWAAGGEPLYGPPSLEHTSWAYPPLYPALSAAAAQLTGWGFVPLRLVSGAASLLAFVMLVAIVRSVTGRWSAGLAAAGVYAATYLPSGLWADTGRPDSLLVLLLLLSIWIAMRAKGIGSGVVLGVVLLLATATKQNAGLVAALLLLGVVLARRRAGVAAAITYAGLLGTGLLVAQTWTDGWFWEYAVTLLPSHSIVWHNLVTSWVLDVGLVLAPTLLVIVTGLGAVAPAAGVRLRDRRWWSALPEQQPTALVLGLGVLGMALAGWAGRLHSGGASNVFMPAYAGIALIAGLAVAAVLGRHGQRALDIGTGRRWLPSGGQLVALLGLAGQVALSVPFLGAAVPTPADRLAGDAVVAAIGRLPGRVLHLDHPHYLWLAGKASNAQLVAVTDLLRAADSRARRALVDSIPVTLQHTDVVLLDRPDDETLFEPTLSAEFVRLPGPGSADPAVFSPVGGVDGRPSIVWVRRGVDVHGLDLDALVASR